MSAPRATSRTGRRRTGSTGGRRRTESGVDLKAADVRAFGRAFDGLVRSVRTHGHAIEGAAERAQALWAALGSSPMEVVATRVLVGDRIALDASEHEVRWLLPSFMAGLRKVTPRAEMSADDLRILSDALSRVDADVASIERLRDWLWSGAATGFDIELQTSFTEALDDLGAESPAAGALDPGLTVGAVRTEVMRSLSEQAVMISPAMLAEAAARDEFDLPLGTAAPLAEAALFAMPGTEAAGLRADCEDPARWSLDELTLLLAHRELHEGARPERLARAALELVRGDRHGAAATILDALTGLARRNDILARDVLRLLDREDFAEAAASALLADPANARRVVEVILAVGETARQSLARALVAQAAREPGWIPALAEMLHASGGRLLPILLATDDVPAPGQLAVLVRLGGDAVLETLFARARADAERWVGLALGALCRVAIERGRGSAMVVSFARDRTIPAAARVEALDIAQGDSSLRAEAAAWRPSELFEAPEVREKLRLMREIARDAR